MDWQGKWAGKAAGVMLFCGAAACTAPPDEAPPPVRDDIEAEVVEAVDPPVSYVDTISIEGTPQEMQVVEYRSPTGFPLGFTTVVPADMEVDLRTSDRGEEVQFVAAFGGVRRPESSLRFVAFPATSDSAEVRDRIEAAVAEVAGTPVERLPGDWAVERYRVGDGYSGSLAVGVEDGNWYYFLTRYPPDYGDGMGPRVDLILRRWQWTGSGSPLRPD